MRAGQLVDEARGPRALDGADLLTPPTSNLQPPTSNLQPQVGDILDRGDQEIQIFYFLERLQREAESAGGKLYVLNGNHGVCISVACGETSG